MTAAPKVPALDPAFLTTPLAHRGLHDLSLGIPENSRAAFRAAVDAGYGIELDIQSTRENDPMVFHDYDLKRLTGTSGPIRMQDQAEVRALTLIGNHETIPTFSEVLEIVDGRVPLLVEIKDQDGAMGPNTGALEERITKALRRYEGPIALMSFNPYSVAAVALHAPNVTRGLITGPWKDSDTQLIPKKRRDILRDIPDFDRVGAAFISHHVDDLDRPQVAALKARGIPILCWTVRSAKAEIKARAVADNVTFEGYLP